MIFQPRGEESDYVASVRADFGKIFDVGTRLRVDESMEVKRIDVDARVNFWRIDGSARYFKVADSSPTAHDGDEGLVPEWPVQGR